MALPRGRKRGVKRGPKKRVREIDYSNPQSMEVLGEAYLESMAINNFSEHTIRVRGNGIRQFTAWCKERDVTQVTDVTEAIAERYKKYLYHLRKPDNKPLSFQTQSQRLVSVRTWFRWLAKKKYILFNPAAELELPKLEKTLPTNILTPNEVELVINQTDLTQEFGVRDRAMLETFYSTGIRRSELMNLKVFDLHMAKGTLAVRKGKGKKDRIVPIGERAIGWIEKYLIESRPHYALEPDEEYLFLSADGFPLSKTRLGDLVHEYIKSAGVGKQGGCHLFRHSMATHMLENGADIRIIQAILGHENLSTTETYTKVSIGHIQEVHRRTHPAKLERKTDHEQMEQDVTRLLESTLMQEADGDD